MLADLEATVISWLLLGVIWFAGLAAMSLPWSFKVRSRRRR